MDTPFPETPVASQLTTDPDTRLVETIDRLLDRGVVVHGDLWLTVADIDLAFVGVHVTLCSHERATETRETAA